MPEVENLHQWLGDDVVDPGGDRIGKLAEIYYDRDTDTPLFLGVQQGRIRHHMTFVPVSGVSVGKNYVATGLARSVVEGAPTVDDDGAVSSDVERELFEYYDMQYQSSFQGGSRLVRH